MNTKIAFSPISAVFFTLILFSGCSRPTFKSIDRAAELYRSGKEDEIETIIKAFDSQDLSLKRHAIETLGNMGIKETIPYLKQFLLSDQIELLDATLEALVKMNDSIVVIDILNSLGTNGGKFDSVRIKGLVKFKGRGMSYINQYLVNNNIKYGNLLDDVYYSLGLISTSYLIENLESSNPEVVKKSGEIIVGIGDSAIWAVMDSIREGNPKKAEILAGFLTSQGVKVIDAILRHLNYDNYDFMQVMREVILKIEPFPNYEIKNAMLNNPNIGIQKFCCNVLAIKGGKEVEQFLLVHLRNNTAPKEVRLEILKCISYFKECSPMSSLSKLLNDPDDDIKFTAQQVMLNVGNKFPQDIEDLIYLEDTISKEVLLDLIYKTPDTKWISNLGQLIYDPEPSIRIKALNCLGKINDEQTINLLINALDDGNELVRSYATANLLRKGGAIVSYVEASLADTTISDIKAELLIYALGDNFSPTSLSIVLNNVRSNPAYWQSSVSASGRLGVAALPAVNMALNSHIPEQQLLALEICNQLKLKDSLFDICNILNDDNFLVRANAIQSLGLIGDSTVIPPLICTFKSGDPLSVLFTLETMRRIGSRAGLNFLYELLAKEQKFYINYILSTCDAIIDNSDKDNKSEICGRLGKLLFERQEWTLAKNYFSKAKEIKSNPETESYIAILDSISDEPRIMTNLSQNNVIDYNKSWYSAELIYRFFSNDTLNEEQLREREEKMVKCARGIRSIFNTEKGLDDSGKKKTSTIIGSLQLDFIRMNSQAVPESYIVVNAVQKKSIEITLNITNTEDDTIFITPYLFKLITKDSVRIAPLLTVQPEDYLYNINRLKILSIPPKSKSNYWLNFIIAKEAVPSALEVEYTDAINRFTVFLSLTR